MGKSAIVTLRCLMRYLSFSIIVVSPGEEKNPGHSEQCVQTGFFVKMCKILLRMRKNCALQGGCTFLNF